MRLIDDEPDSLFEKVSNKNYSADVNLSMQYTRWFLTLLGIWPGVISNSTKIERCVSRFLMPFPSTIITILVIPIASIPFFRDTSPTQFLMLLAPLSFRTTSVIKNVILISRRDAIRFCIRHMEIDWQRIECDDDREIMMKNLRVGRKLTIICVLCMYSGTIFYNILPFVSPRKINSMNETVRPITVPGIDIYVDLRTGHNYEIVLFASCVSVFYVSAIIIAICNLAAVLVCHACGQIQIVMSRLGSLVGNDDKKETDTVAVQKGIAFIIETHVRVLRFASKIDQVLRELCLIEVFAATLIICLVAYMCITINKFVLFLSDFGYYLADSNFNDNLEYLANDIEGLSSGDNGQSRKKQNLKRLPAKNSSPVEKIMERKNTSIMALISYTTLLVSLSFNIFIFCRIGELLKDQCQAVGKAAYMTEWYRLPGRTGLALVMFITMANYPRKLTAGRIIELSITTFGNIMRTSFGYLNMLRTMTE